MEEEEPAPVHRGEARATRGQEGRERASQQGTTSPGGSKPCASTPNLISRRSAASATFRPARVVLCPWSGVSQGGRGACQPLPPFFLFSEDLHPCTPRTSNSTVDLRVTGNCLPHQAWRGGGDDPAPPSRRPPFQGALLADVRVPCRTRCSLGSQEGLCTGPVSRQLA